MNIDLYIPWLTLAVTGLLVGYVIARKTKTPYEIFDSLLANVFAFLWIATLAILGMGICFLVGVWIAYADTL